MTTFKLEITGTFVATPEASAVYASMSAEEKAEIIAQVTEGFRLAVLDEVNEIEFDAEIISKFSEEASE